jgi:hypothetical protein
MRSSTFKLLLATGLVAACTPAYNPWLVPDDRVDTFLGTARTIWVLDALEFPGHTGRMTRAPLGQILWLPQLDALVDQELRTAGFVVVRPPEYRARLDAQAREHGLLDAATGRLDSVRAALADRHALEQVAARNGKLATRYPPDAILHLYVVNVPAHVKGATARWDGVEQDVCVSVEEDCSGSILPGLSLCAFLAERSGAALYQKCGGIHMAMSFDDHGDLEEETTPLDDAARNLAAVRMALEPLLSRPKPVVSVAP